MITFVELGKYGRLGNQLFQYAALKSLGLKKGYEVKIPNLSYMFWHGQSCLLRNFDIEAEYLTPEDYKKINFLYAESNVDLFDKKFFDIPDNTNLHGFFQSLYHFEEFEEQIKKELTPKKEFLERSKEFIDKYRENGKYEVVSIHVRRGDMMTHMHEMSPSKVFSAEDIFDTKTIFGDYLTRAIKYFENKNVKYIVFAGGKRDGDDTEDINFIKKAFKGDKFVLSNSNDPMFDFTTIMCCDHNITCHQSTFGWWAAFLNKNKKKVVISPKNYYFILDEERNKRRTSNGHFPSDWTLI